MALALVLAAALAGAGATPARAAAPLPGAGAGASGAGSAAGSRALVVFVEPPNAPLRRNSSAPDDAVLRVLAAQPQLALGIVSAAQGVYFREQALLDVTQGTRVADSSYDPSAPPLLDLSTFDHRGAIKEWPLVARRAVSAPQTIVPGLLASSVPGGAAYVGISHQRPLPAVVAADRSGRLAALSLGAARTLRSRVAAATRDHRLLIVDLPHGRAGRRLLGELLAGRPDSELVLAMERPPTGVGHELEWIGAAGLGSGELESKTTNVHGMVATIDVAPTVLRHLGRPVPAAMRGQPMTASGSRDVSSLHAFKRRLVIVQPRRIATLKALLAAWAALALLGVAVGLMAGLRWEGLRWAGRVGALAFLWAPVGAMAGALADTTLRREEVVITAVCFGLGLVTDQVLPWPRGPFLPAVVGIAAIAIDALAGTHLLLRSLLGPNPSFGARFYGIGNELKSGLTVLALAGAASALYPARPSRRAAAWMAGTGLVVAVLLGSARLGAGVGGVVIAGVATAVAAAMLLPGGFTPRRAALVLISPVVALGGLVVLDLATAGGRGHLTHNVVEAHTRTNLHDTIVRRLNSAVDALELGLMPVAVAAALVAVVLALLLRRRLYGPLPDPAWRAALVAGLVGGLVGAVVEDSGPVLLVVAVFALGCLTVYIQGAPRRRRRAAGLAASGGRQPQRARAPAATRAGP
jgi:hypothetical protein